VINNGSSVNNSELKPNSGLLPTTLDHKPPRLYDVNRLSLIAPLYGYVVKRSICQAIRHHIHLKPALILPLFNNPWVPWEENEDDEDEDKEEDKDDGEDAEEDALDRTATCGRFRFSVNLWWKNVDGLRRSVRGILLWVMNLRITLICG